MVNIGGNPASGLEIHIKNHFSPGGFVEGEHLKEGLEIPYQAKATGDFKLDIYRLGTNTPFAEVFDEHLDVYDDTTMVIPDSLLSNGVYLYKLTDPNNKMAEGNFFLINKPDSSLVTTRPLTTTNVDGEFEIDVDYLAIDTRFGREGENSFVITDSLQVIVVKNSAIVAKEFMRVTNDNFVEINLNTLSN